ncbi:MAG: GNAT family N-acetyltransferase [Novosphingobium sp.]
MIETARLILRPPHFDDLSFILAQINTDSMMRHLGGQARSADQVAEGLAQDVAAFADGSYFRWTVWLKENELRIGRVGLFEVRAAAAPAALRGQREIGWMLAESVQGRGFATEAARAVLGHGFRELDLPAIHSQTSDSNLASTRMMERLGFERRAELDYVDPDYPSADNPTTVYCLRRGEWASRDDGVRD